MQPAGVGSAQWILPGFVSRRARTGRGSTLARALRADRCAAALAITLIGLGLAGAPAYAQVVHTPTPRLITAEPDLDRAWLTPRRVHNTKAAVATAATALLLWGAVLRRRGQADAHRRPRDAALIGLGLLGAACWWNLFQLHHPHYLHKADQYLYFTGAKYFAELGYDRLYHCTAVAEAQGGLAEVVAKRPMRDVRNNVLTRGAEALESREACTDHFSPERWRDFQGDIAFFTARIAARQWRLTQTDHGYNATPAWSVLAITLANTGPATDARVLALALIDPALLLVMWGGFAWAFGWRAACVGAVFWGTSYMADFGWTGGAYLRQDWLAASVLSLCLLRRGRPAGAGFLLGVAALLRIFPALIGVGLGLRVLTSLWRRRTWRLEPGHARFALGGLAALAALGPLSVAVAGPDAWPAFVKNSRVHLDTPLQNYVGLKSALSYDHDARARRVKDVGASDPWGPWKQARRRAFEGRQWLFVGLVAAYLGLLTWAVSRQDDWVAAALGIGVIVMSVELTGYYYAVLLGTAALFTRRESVGVALCGLSAVGWWIVNQWHFYDEIYTWMSLACVAFVVFATLALALAARKEAEARDASEEADPRRSPGTADDVEDTAAETATSLS